MNTKQIRRRFEKEFCGDKKLECDPEFEVGQNNLIPYEKTYIKCKCKRRQPEKTSSETTYIFLS